MSKLHQKTAFLFRRDLRLEDNLGLLQALETSEHVLPVFVFDDRQIDPRKNEYFSAPAFHFLLQSLRELDAALHERGCQLFVFHGDPTEVVTSLIKQDNIDAVYMNKDYTPFARRRDKAIADLCAELQVGFERTDDLVLSPIEYIRTGQDKIYTVFTPFMKNAAQNDVPEPRKNNFSNYVTESVATTTVKLSAYVADIGDRDLALQGGRGEALAIMSDPVFLENYQDDRNRPDLPTSTSRLSAHHKFGTISIRESYHLAAKHAGPGSNFISELYWRDFYYYTAYHFPLIFKKSFLPWAKHLAWRNNEEEFAAWCAGKTGVPMVDAGMRELNKTGFMHNRTRMVVASYLTKNLLINWQWGEKYFATQLLDYDPAQNNGGWQWSASVGTDTKPLRIFNSYVQAQKFDPNATYIKRWVEELRDVAADKITDGKTQDFSTLAPGYPAPIIDQKESYHHTMATFKTAKETWKAEKIAANS